ncbi:hypothetical protein [Streptomyces sp. NPDC090036]|uniref:hypothetical protein n=1 Tax=Streptomyces sp. NPDC090036 TaxID=3365926 RepID=UPI00382EECA8
MKILTPSVRQSARTPAASVSRSCSRSVQPDRSSPWVSSALGGMDLSLPVGMAVSATLCALLMRPLRPAE